MRILIFFLINKKKITNIHTYPYVVIFRKKFFPNLFERIFEIFFNFSQENSFEESETAYCHDNLE